MVFSESGESWHCGRGLPDRSCRSGLETQPERGRRQLGSEGAGKEIPNLTYFHPLISYWCLPLVEARGQERVGKAICGVSKGYGNESGSK